MKLNHIIAVLAILIGASACSEDPVPIYISGNPRVDLVRDSIVVQGSEGEQAAILAVHMTPEGEMFAGGIELRPDGQYFQGDIWTHDGTLWRSALDPATRDLVLSVDDLDASPSGTVYAVADLKTPVGLRSSAVLRRDGDAWIDISPSSLTYANGCNIVSDDEIWLYGNGAVIPHYTNGEWEMTELPEPWNTYHPNDLRVTAVSGGEESTHALAELLTGETELPHILFRWEDSLWTPIYREGKVEGAGEDDRQLQTLLRSRDGVLIASGRGIYRLDGDQLAHLQNHPQGNLFRSSFLSPEGNIIVAGDGNAMRWSNGEGWYGVHVDSPTPVTFISVAMSDTMIVAAGILGSTLNPEYVLQHGTITRRIP